jgi:hypothetical protein
MGQTKATRKTRQTALAAVFERSANRAGLFIPSVEFYNSLHTPSGLEVAAKEIYRWLGIKPRLLAIDFDDAPDIASGEHTIVIPAHYREFPYQTGALLALSITQTVLTHHLDTVDEELIEFATIDCGLGLLVLNGLHGKRPLHVQLYHFLSGHWHTADDVTLITYTTESYAHAVMAHALVRHPNRHDWIHAVNPDVQKLLPAAQRSKAPTRPRAHARHQANARRQVINILLASVIVSLGAAFALSQYPLAPSVNNRPPQSTEVLQAAYFQCLSNLAEQQRIISPQNNSQQQELKKLQEHCQQLRSDYNKARLREN